LKDHHTAKVGVKHQSVNQLINQADHCKGAIPNNNCWNLYCLHSNLY